MLWNTISTYLQSWFDYSGVAGYMILFAAGLAVVFIVVWMLGHRPPVIKKPGLWLTAVISALLTMLATAFIYVSINYFYVQWLGETFDAGMLNNTLPLWCIPVVLSLGLVQEGAKTVSMLFWRMSKVKPDISSWVVVGAMSGAGFGIFEAFNSMCSVFGSDWQWSLVSTEGFTALLPFWVCFWVVACHIGISALVGYGLGKGKGWAFYFMAVFIHALLFYFSVLATNDTITSTLYGAVVSLVGLVVILISYWLRWRRYGDEQTAEVAAPTLSIKKSAPPPVK
jgi:hypothetical protein